MTFIRKQEDFICEVCNAEVSGNGYTNHCPNCLWSKHVDEEIPGDRKATCQGLMKPIGLEIKGQEYIITHQCEKCGKTIKNQTAKNDSFEEILKLSKSD
ncbi:MAG: RNHCP domain-containing protein [Patescibacteria group bacterium]|nr:RNHCP domain-containing protein [Patescibacteria group bacterium]